MASRIFSDALPRRWKAYLVVSALTMIALSAHAQDDVCRQDGTGRDAAICATQAWKQADVKLNEAYRQTLGMLADTQYAPIKAALINAQRAWIKFRDADCDVQQHIYAGGSMDGAIVAACLRDLTERRTKELQEISLP
jgi:uncharacterized protein YecT (DUF1311 family)